MNEQINEKTKIKKNEETDRHVTYKTKCAIIQN